MQMKIDNRITTYYMSHVATPGNRRMKNFILSTEHLWKGKYLILLYFWTLRLFCECKECLDGYFCPYFGKTPHETWFCIKGSVKSVPTPLAQWPDNFVESPEGGGMYYCKNDECDFSKKKIIERIIERRDSEIKENYDKYKNQILGEPWEPNN